MKKYSLFWLILVGLLMSAILTSQSMAAEFHVTNATEFQNALSAARSNGKDDTIYLASGIYQGNFIYASPNPEHKSLTIAGEPGTSAEDVILDGQNRDIVLTLGDFSEGTVADVRINGITVRNGNSTVEGGGIYAALAMHNIAITNCILKNNRAQRYGGGVYMDSSKGTLTLENNLIMDNTITEDSKGISRGGGAAMITPSGDYYSIRNNIFARNTAQGSTDSQGGGLWVGWGSSNVIHLIGNTFYGNHANKGGGIYLSYGNTANVYNNIIYENTAAQGKDIYLGSIANRIGYSNNYSDIFGAWTASGSNLNTDPLFLDPANNDFHLKPNSPMINAGTTAVPDPPGLPSADIEGNPRVIGSAPDIGAYEFSPVNPAVGTIGTEMEITGSGYGKTRGKVLVGNIATKILQWADSSIRCQLTRVLPAGTYDVTIQPKGVSAIVLHDSFSVMAPEISHVDPTSGSLNDQITVYGSFFSTKRGKVTLGGKNCRITSWTMDATTGDSEVRFVVPRGLSSGTYQLQIKNSLAADSLDFNVK
jgi:parallel beta-helix repeat protein